MKRIVIFGIHFSYWFIYFLLSGIVIGFLNKLGGELKYAAFINTLFWVNNFIPSILGFYIFHYFVFAKFLKKKKYIQLVLLGFLIAVLIGVLMYPINYFIVSAFGQLAPSNGSNFEILGMFTFMTGVLSLIHGVLGLFLKGFFDWFNLQKEKEVLIEKNHTIELELVKSQLNPHFLFNSLNNIDVLIHKDQEKASRYLTKLSEIMRYMLFDSKTEYVPLYSDFQFIEKYIDLQKLRSKSEKYIQLHKNIKDDSGLVSSLVFIPFIENAFKYSASYKQDNAILIDFIQVEKGLRFICKNRIATSVEIDETSNGLGNNLLRKRLDLLYKNDYQLNIFTEDDYFYVDLTIPYEVNYTDNVFNIDQNTDRYR